MADTWAKRLLLNYIIRGYDIHTALDRVMKKLYYVSASALFSPKRILCCKGQTRHVL